MEYQLEGKGGLGESRGGWRIGRQLVLWELPPQCQAAPGSTTEQGAPGTALNQSRPGKWTENRGTLSQRDTVPASMLAIVSMDAFSSHVSTQSALRPFPYLLEQ